MPPAGRPQPVVPDSPLVERVEPSPNHGERAGGRAPDMLILHYTGMPDAAGALARMCDPASEVSAHYLVLEGGAVLQLVPEDRRAWHAGAGGWGDESDINSRSIGIEIAHPGHAGGLPPYPAAQIEAVTRLCADVARRRRIAPERVLAHSDVAPARKEDPGELFPWDALHRAGIGRWVPPASPGPGRALAPGDRNAEVAVLQRDLRRYGYVVAESGVYDDGTTAVVTAFQRHFRPSRVDGVADPSTRATLDALLRDLEAPTCRPGA